MPSRRDQIAMTDEELDRFLRAKRTLIIVSNGKDGFPHPMPMFYCVDNEGRLIISTFGKSQKVKNFERDPKAALLVEAGEEYENLKSVVMKATAEIITDYDTVLQGMIDIALSRIAKDGGSAEPDMDAIRARVEHTAKKRVLVRFTPVETMSWDHEKLGGVY